MHVTPETVDAQYRWVRDRPTVVPLVNGVRDDLGAAFGTDVDHVTPERYREEVDRVFEDGDLAVNVAALVAILRDLDVADDYPGFVVDELLGRRLAGTIVGGQPLELLAEATFHYADAVHHPDEAVNAGEGGDEGGSPGVEDSDIAGLDDLDAALAAGFQTRLPGWEWRERESPFGVEP